MPRGQIKVAIKPPIQGFRADMPEWLLPPECLAEGENVLVRYNRLVVRPGYAGFGGNLTDRVLGGYHWQTTDQDYHTVCATAKKRYAFNPASGLWEDITGTAGTATESNQWRFVTFPWEDGVFLIGVNDKDGTIVWDGDASTDYDLGGNAPIAKDVTVLGNRVVYANCTIGGDRFPNAVMYSEFNDHTVTPADNIINVGETSGIIVGIHSLNVQSFALYLTKGQFVGTLQSSFAPYAIDQRGWQAGPVSPAAIVGVGEVNYYLGTDCNVYRFDGSRCVPVGNHVQPAIFKDLDPPHRHLAHGVFDRRFREVWWWWVPRGESGLLSAICFNIDEERWSPIQRYTRSLTASFQWDERSATKWSDLSGTWVTLGQTYPSWNAMATTYDLSQVLGDDAGNTYVMGRSGQDAGYPIEARWRTPLQAMAQYGKDIRADAIEHYIPQRDPSMLVKYRLVQSEGPGLPKSYVPASGFVEIDTAGGSYDDRLTEYEQELAPWAAVEYRVENPNVGFEWHGALLYLYGLGVAA
jgi:hypothetical protein